MAYDEYKIKLIHCDDKELTRLLNVLFDNAQTDIKNMYRVTHGIDYKMELYARSTAVPMIKELYKLTNQFFTHKNPSCIASITQTTTYHILPRITFIKTRKFIFGGKILHTNRIDTDKYVVYILSEEFLSKKEFKKNLYKNLKSIKLD